MADDLYNYSGKLAYLQAVCRDPRLGRSELAVMSILVEHADKAKGTCYPSIARMVETAQVSKSAAIRALRKLQEAGWIQASKRNGALTNYTLTGVIGATGVILGTGVIHAQTGVIQNLHRGPTGSERDTEAVPGMTPEQGKSKSNRVQQNVQADFFLKFWHSYPRKEAKAKALSIWKAQKLDQIADRIIEDVEARVADVEQWQDPRFIPHATTYLNQRRWEDEWKTLPNGIAGRLPRDTRAEDEIAAANEAQLRRMEAMG